MSARRAHVVLPEDLVKEIDRAVGAKKRSAFLAEVVRRELKRRRLMEVLQDPDPIWKDEDHPELQAGTESWVAQLRSEAEARNREAE